MAFMLRRHTLDVLLVAFFFVLLCVFVNRYTMVNHKDYSVIEQDVPNEIRLDPVLRRTLPDRLPIEDIPIKIDASNLIEIDPRVKEMAERRTASCQRTTSTKKVSVILDFNDYQFFDAKNTISSLEVTNSWDLIEELLLIDDASTLDYVKEDAKKFLGHFPKVKLLRGSHLEPIGQGRARTIASRQAKSDILVFLDSKTLVTAGWLEPLIELLEKDPKAVAVPHYDIIKDPVSLEYQTTSDRTVATFSWNLAIRMKKSNPEDEGSSKGEDRDGSYRGGRRLKYKSPVMRGNAFGIRKEFFESIGGYDEGLEDIGGESLELSLRIWLCGGNIAVLACSRVGIMNLYDPVKVTSKRNTVRIAEMWFGDRKSTVYRSSNLNSGLRAIRDSDGMEDSIDRRRQQIEQNYQCKTIEWYLKNVALSMVTPSQDAVMFGILKVKTGRCSRLLSSMKIKLDECKQENFNKHPPEMIFELNKAGQIKVMDKCLTVKNNAYILAETCRAGDNKQQFKFLTEQLINVWSTYCAMHVTDPDKETEGDRQIAMAQGCGAEGSNGDSFKKWEFIAV